MPLALSRFTFQPQKRLHLGTSKRISGGPWQAYWGKEWRPQSWSASTSCRCWLILNMLNHSWREHRPFMFDFVCLKIVSLPQIHRELFAVQSHPKIWNVHISSLEKLALNKVLRNRNYSTETCDAFWRDLSSLFLPSHSWALGFTHVFGDKVIVAVWCVLFGVLWRTWPAGWWPLALDWLSLGQAVWERWASKVPGLYFNHL